MKRFLAWTLVLILMVCFGSAAAEAAAEGSLVPASDKLVIPVGEFRKAKFDLSPARLEKGGAIFESSDESIATTRYNGNVKGEAVGECTLTITSKRDPSVKATMLVQVVQPAEKVTLTVPETTMTVGQTMQAEYTVLPETATLKDVVFSSSKNSVATVDENGLITAHARGTANITVKSADGEASRRVKITVQQLPQQVTLKQAEYSLSVGKKLKLKATVLPSNANNQKCTWTSSDESIAKVSSNGTVTAVSTGDAVITVTSQAAPSVSTSTVVHCVRPMKSIGFDAEVYDLDIGRTLQLSPVIKPDDATKTAILYQSRHSRIASVDENGLVTAMGGGETTITVTSAANSKVKGSVRIRVHVPVEGVVIEKQAVRLGVGDHVFAPAKVLPQDATTKDMIWVSSDETVASASGTSHRARVEGHKWGSCVLTGTTVDGGYTASVTINVGTLAEAVTVQSASAAGGKVQVVLKNHSDMHITGVTLALDGAAEESAKLALDLAPGAVSEPIVLETAAAGRVDAAVSAWETDTGFVNNSGKTLYSYRIPYGLQLWASGK